MNYMVSFIVNAPNQTVADEIAANMFRQGFNGAPADAYVEYPDVKFMGSDV